MLTVDAYLTAAGVSARAVDLWHAPLEVAAERFAIDTAERIIPWLATCVHESGRFQRFEENLNYSADALLRLWPRRFTPASAESYARRPERIANHIYANRMGNGDEASGDGWRYRGRGPIQLTGYDNMRACGLGIGIDVVNDPDALLQPDTGSLSAAWFWHSRDCNEAADAGDLHDIRRRVNGGTIGLTEFVAIVAVMRAVA